MASCRQASTEAISEPRFSVGPVIDYSDFSGIVRGGNMRAVILARHGERPSIAPDDPTFGRTLPLTAAGEALARACGRALRSAGRPEEWTFGASQFRRTLLTAAYVAEEIGAPPEAATVCAEVGIPGLWIEDAAAVHAAQLRLGVRVYHDRQMREGEAEGFWPIRQCARNVLVWLSSHSIATRLAFFSTHDCHLGCLLNGLGAAQINADHWVGFLQGCALFEQPDSSWRAHYLVPDKTNYANEFIF